MGIWGGRERGDLWGLFVEGCDRMEDGLNDGLIPNSGIDHEMEEMTGGPLYPEVLLDKGGAVAVHGLRKLDRVLLVLSHFAPPVNLLFEGSVDKNVKGVGPLVQVICRAPPHNDGV